MIKTQSFEIVARGPLILGAKLILWDRLPACHETSDGQDGYPTAHFVAISTSSSDLSFERISS
jgi:hypothetical protein